MATMADVARSAGVSVATVSHVLNDTRPVLPHTRQAVLDAVEELGYTPNTLARSLVTSRTRSIGLAVSAISNPYFTEILQGVEAGALEHGYSLLIADPHDDPEHERKVVQLLHERRVDGMIVAPSADPRRARRLPGAARRADGVPGPAGRTPPTTDGRPRFDQVCADNAEPMAGLVTHLAGLGHRRIGLVAGRPGLSTTSERITGYRQRSRVRGAARTTSGSLVHGDSESAGAEQATAALLSLAVPPTALVTGNNAMTIGAPACPARPRPVRAGRHRAVLLRRLRLGRPVLAPAHRDRAAQQGHRRPGRPRAPGASRRARTGRPGPCGCPPPSSIARRAAARTSRRDPSIPNSLSSPSSPNSPRSPRKEPSHDRRRR